MARPKKKPPVIPLRYTGIGVLEIEDPRLIKLALGKLAYFRKTCSNNSEKYSYWLEKYGKDYSQEAKTRLEYKIEYLKDLAEKAKFAEELYKLLYKIE
jgi:hypothetical protein